jgi:hypothetical protein
MANDPSPARLQVLVVDEDGVRDALQRVLSQSPRLHVIADARPEQTTTLLEHQPPQVVLAGTHPPHRALSLLAELASLHPKRRPLAIAHLTRHDPGDGRHGVISALTATCSRKSDRSGLPAGCSPPLRTSAPAWDDASLHSEQRGEAAMTDSRDGEKNKQEQASVAFRVLGNECSACHEHLQPDWQFCAHCETRLATACPACGVALLHTQ